MLAVATMVKNEAPRMREWLAHYSREGCCHFFIVDNGSTDELKEAVEGWPVTLLHDDRRFQSRTQTRLLTEHVVPRLTPYEWVLVCDVDEYLYATEGRVVEVLRGMRMDVQRVWIPWKLFGSSGLKEQPESIVQGFTKRAARASLPYEKVKTGYVPHLGVGKSVNRTKGLQWLSPHEAGHEPRSILFTGDGVPAHMCRDPNAGKLRLNHYMLQSEAYYNDVKCARGGGESGKVGKYTMAYFHEADEVMNEVEDMELKNSK
jgi:hypothetical protein